MLTLTLNKKLNIIEKVLTQPFYTSASLPYEEESVSSASLPYEEESVSSASLHYEEESGSSALLHYEEEGVSLASLPYEEESVSSLILQGVNPLHLRPIPGSKEGEGFCHLLSWGGRIHCT